MDSQKISQQLLGQNRRFLYIRLKLGRCLAYRLAETSEIKHGVSMQEYSGECIVSPAQKLKIFSDCYIQLYTSEHPLVENIGEKLIFEAPIVSEIQRESLNQPISVNKILKAIARLKVNKTSRPDGLTSEFYKTFKFFFAARLYKVYNFVFESKIFPTSWQEALMVLIPKEEKDLRKPYLYRPISLLNTDYKILTYVLAMRLLKVRIL